MSDRDLEQLERMKLIYIIEGLQDELRYQEDSIEHYRARDTVLKRLCVAARRRIISERRNWFVHGVGIGFIVGYLTGQWGCW